MLSEVISWLLLLLVVYVYVGYPLLLILAGFLGKKRVAKEDITPTVSFMIAAYNEEKALAQKLENTLSLDYPKEQLEIVVVSDGSTDSTDEIALSYADRGVKLYRVEGRVGKTEARNRAVAESTQEIVIFSDATTRYEREAVRKLVRNFADESVGQVSGKLKYSDSKEGNVGVITKLYWRYENLLKEAQSRIGTLTGVTGCINAFRREHYTPLPPQIIEDLTEPLLFVLKGWRVVFEKEAIGYEEPDLKPKDEFRMRVRVVRGGVAGVLFAKKLLNFFEHPFAALQLTSHKILRWGVGYFAVIMLISSALATFGGGSEEVALLLLAQVVFYTLGFVGYKKRNEGRQSKIFSIPFYFCLINAAAAVALYRAVTSELLPTWEPIRD